jgi:nucleoside-diphosphate-sugar epimerase
VDYKPKDEDDYCPDTLYGKSKMLGEQVVRKAEDLPFSWLIVRPIGIWGPWFDVPYKNLFNMIKRGLYFHTKGKKVTQALGFVGNTVHQFDTLLNAQEEKIQGRVFYLSDKQPLDMQEWTNLIQKAFNARLIPTVSYNILKIVATFGDILKTLGLENPPLSGTRLKNMLTSFVYDIDPMITENLPFTLEESVQATVDWMKDNNKRIGIS